MTQSAFFYEVRENSGQIAPGIPVTILNADLSLATIYDQAGDSIDNPIFSRSDGLALCYLTDGSSYNLRIGDKYIIGYTHNGSGGGGGGATITGDAGTIVASDGAGNGVGDDSLSLDISSTPILTLQGVYKAAGSAAELHLEDRDGRDPAFHIFAASGNLEIYADGSSKAVLFILPDGTVQTQGPITAPTYPIPAIQVTGDLLLKATAEMLIDSPDLRPVSQNTTDLGNATTQWKSVWTYEVDFTDADAVHLGYRWHCNAQLMLLYSNDAAVDVLQVDQNGLVITARGQLTAIADIVAGSGITVTPTGNTVVIAASGGGGAARAGVVAMSGAPVVVADASITAKSVIMLTGQNTGPGIQGTLQAVPNVGVGFTIHSTYVPDVGNIGYLIVESP